MKADLEEYVKRFDASLVGTTAEKGEWHAELVGYLDDARENGDLDGVLERLGAPREAAAAFRSARPLPLASLDRRFLAQAIDFVPLIVVAGLILAHQLSQDGPSFAWGFPIGLVISSGDPLWLNVARSLTVLWSWLGLATIESVWGGRTAGKALLGIRTVSDDGTTLTFGQALTRRWSIMLGPLAWIDWAAALMTVRRQRLLDVLGHTIVVGDPSDRRVTGSLDA